MPASIEQYAKLVKVSLQNIERLGIRTVHDLLLHFPFRYDDLSLRVPINRLKIGEVATVKGRIDIIATKRARRRGMYITEALFADDTGTIKLVWFNQPFIGKMFQAGDMAFMSGVVEADYSGFKMVSPTYEKLSSTRGDGETLHTGRIVPIYSVTQGVTSRQLRLMLKKSLIFIPEFKEFLPNEILEKYKLMKYQQALGQIHFPDSMEMARVALRRLKFNELILLQLFTLRMRYRLRSREAYKVAFHLAQTKNFVDCLAYKLTDTQRKSAWEILTDMNGESGPMNRLLEGDVGSGKTVVASLALYQCFLNGFQGLLVVPTEILANQHFFSLQKFFLNKGVRIGLLTAKSALYYDSSCDQTITLKKRELEEKILKGEVDIIIGTHALLQERVEFYKVALIIVDEQHRFGVKQRQIIKERLYEKGGFIPHFLSMTATPIPRSLALALYGELDLSIIDQMPVGRLPVETRLESESSRAEVYTFMRKEIDLGRRCFVVCPLILQSDKSGVKSVEQEFVRLDNLVFQDLKIEMLHGRLKKNEKEAVMERFVSGESHILISTTVIEVGVDIPSASVIVIEEADRFGLAQLHQLRGRVGRSSYQSYCFLFTSNDSEQVLERLKIFCFTNNGFDLAQKDLELRGAGDVYGYKQSGASSLKLAKMTDVNLIKQTHSAARAILEADPELSRDVFLREKIDEMERLIDLE